MSIPTDNLVGFWKMDENTGTNVADSGSGGNDGTMGANASWNSDDGCVGEHSINTPADVTTQGDASIDFGRCAELEFTASESFSLSLWFRVASLPSAWQFILGKGWSNAATEMAIYITSGNAIRWLVDGSSFDTAGTIFKANEWTHLVVVQEHDHSTEKRRIYVNGVKEATNTLAKAGSATSDFIIGGRKAGAVAYEDFIGDVDWVRAYSRDLTDAEITSIFEECHPNLEVILA